MKRLDDTHASSELFKRIAACQGSEETNDWEEDFLRSIEERALDGHDLTEKQEETLEKIEYKVNFGAEAYWEEYGDGR